MNTGITPARIASYQADGFVTHPGLLSAAEVAELKAAVLDSVATLGKKKMVGGVEEGDSYYDRIFTQRVNLWLFNDVVKRYMFNAELGRTLCRLAGVESLRVWHDQTLIKEPFGNPTAWHLDNPYWSFDSRHSISIWIALEDATLENGCMWFIPGTQKMARFESPGIGMNMSDLFKMYPEMAKVDPVPAPLKAGDCSFHNGLCAHGAGANMTRKRRIAMTCAYMPVGSTYNGNRNVLPQDYVATLKPGDVLENDDWNPVVGVAACVPQGTS
ncbi:MAG: phytanoyl-CoA dioxygenase family protein [Phycisphaeraceae bacterium]|nr:phytanoyl-CoA dioxygenase family protein [Phycisphaeraceae bacterium]